MDDELPVYICANCGEKFESEWSDEEAEQEMLTNFGNLLHEDRAVVCDDCYEAMRASAAKQ